MPGSTTTRRPALRAGAALGLVSLLGLGGAGSALGDPGPVYPSEQQVAKAKAAVTSTAGQVAELEAQYAAASAQLEQVRQLAAAKAEAYNGARVKLQEASREAAAAAKRAQVAQDEADAASLKVRQYAATVYQAGGSLGELDAYLSSTGPQDLLDRATALEAVSDARSRSLQQAQAASVVARTMRAQAEAAKEAQTRAEQAAAKARDEAQAQADAAEKQAASISQQQQQLTVQLATLRKTSVDLERQRQEGLAAAAAARAAAAEAARQARIAAQRAARDRAARAAAKRAADEAARQKAAAEAAQKAAEQPKPKPKPKPDPKPPAPPPSRGGVSAVIAYAEAQIGKPYAWGADGPNSFDCSGLTMRAWQQAGVYLSHYTGYQWNETRRVAISDLQPGDLVFYGSSGPSSHHVGLYVGGGQMIEAPYTGANVRYASIYRSDLLPYGGRP